MRYLLEHTYFWACKWDIVAGILLVAAIIFTWQKLKKMKEEKADLEARLTEKNAAEAAPVTAAEPEGQNG